MQIPEKRIKKMFDAEADRQIDIMIGGAALALNRYHGWGQKRLQKFLWEVQETWTECMHDPTRSILMMLEDETDIILTDENGCDWHKLDYLNGNMDRKLENMTETEYMYMRFKQIHWIGTQFLGSVMLALHRIYGWGGERNTQLMYEIYDIKAEFNGRQGKITNALKKETGIEMVRFKHAEQQEDGEWA